MTKILIILAVISICSAGIIPKGFRANEHVSHSKSEISDFEDGENCIHKVRWRRLKSVPTRRMRQDEGSYSDIKENHLNQQTEQLRNSVHGIDGGLEKTKFVKSFVEYAESSKDQRSLKHDFQNHNINELKTPENNFIKLFSSNLESSKETKLTDSEENMEHQTEELQTSLHGNEKLDKTDGFNKSFVEYADTNEKQRSFDSEIQNQSIHELKIAENSLSEINYANFDTLENLLSDIKENNLNKSNEFQNTLQENVKFNDTVFTESFVEFTNSNKTKSPEAEFRKPIAKELEAVKNDLSETTAGTISENRLSEVLEDNSDSFETNSTDAVETSTYELVVSSINTSDIFEFLNLTNSLNLEIVTENISSGFLDVDETALMSEGSEIALFQDDSTTGFEFLIDSETSKNLILTELLRSENFVVTEKGKIAFFDEFPDFDPEIELDVEGGNGIENIVTIKANDIAIPMEKNLSVTGLLDDPRIVQSEETAIDNSAMITDHNATVSMDEKSDSTANFNSSITSDEERLKVADTIFLKDLISTSTEHASKICPTPSICIFWLFAQDSCLDSSECHGSSMCCRMGCSKICVVV